MSKSREQKSKIKASTQNGKGIFRYAEYLEAAGRERVKSITTLDPLLPNLAIDDITQKKLMSVINIMDGIGKMPGDFPKEKFDQPITFHRLPADAIEWLGKNGFRANKTTPFATYSYRQLFASKEFCVVEEKIIEKFFSHLIHCLLVETQIILARQYYYGLGFYTKSSPIIDLSGKFPAEIIELFSQPRFNQIAIDQLHGKIYVDYLAVMIRAQWDKLVSLCCFVFGLKQNWDSISDGIKALTQEVESNKDLHAACIASLKVFLMIASERTIPEGWLKNYRDSLLHGVGQHSSGVVPHKKSVQTTSELWDKICEEHNCLREGMIALLIAFATKNFGSQENTAA